MKLIDLLVKKTNEEGWGWPGKSTFCYQVKQEHGSITKFFDRNGVKVVDYCWEKCDDASAFNELTKEQYESALAASDGWIEWGGGECPVDEGVLVEVKYRNEMPFHIKGIIPADELDWSNGNVNGDIIAYRIHKPDINSRANDDRLEQDLNECIGQDVDMPEWNGDGLPPVGTKCEHCPGGTTQHEWEVVTVAGVHENTSTGFTDYWLVRENGSSYIVGNPYRFRPLRTEAERARDKLAASLHIAAGASPIELNGIGSLYFKLADAIISGSVFGTTFKAGK